MNRQPTRALPAMTDSKIREVHAILTAVDAALRLKLSELGVEIHHVILAVTPDGTGIVRSNVDADGLGDMAELLDQAAAETASTRPDDEPLN